MSRNGNHAVWITQSDPGWQTELALPREEDLVLLLDIRSNLVSYLRIEVDLLGGDPHSGYRFPILIDWIGEETLALHLCAFTPFGTPGDRREMNRLRLTAIDAAYEGTVLELTGVRWAESAPLVRINEQERLLVNFQCPIVWDPSQWRRSAATTLPDADCGMSVEWAHAKLWYIERENRSHCVAFERSFDFDLAGYQAVSAFLSTDRRARCSIVLQIDGQPVPVIDKQIGRGEAEEFRLPVTGGKLESIIVRLDDIPETRGSCLNQEIRVDLRWVMLELEGADPARNNEVRGMAPIPSLSETKADSAAHANGVAARHADAPRHANANADVDADAGVGAVDAEAEAFPFGFVLDRERMNALKKQVGEGKARHYAEQIVAEAERNADYRPEPFVGAYVPVDFGGIGFNRASAPGLELKVWISCLLNSSLAYALTGELRYADTARRVLLALIACDNWSQGFITRFPRGIPAYRYPMVEAHVVEAVALCYDILYPLLTQEERDRTEDAAFSKVVGVSDQILRQHRAWLVRSNQGPIYFLGFLYAALLSRRRHPEVERLIARHLPLFREMLELICRPDGSTNEGSGYWAYGMQSVTTGMLVVSRCLNIGLDSLVPDSLRNTTEFLLHMRSTASRELNFIPIADGYRPDVHHMIGSSLLFYATCLGDRNALWLWEEGVYNRGVPLYYGSTTGQFSTIPLLTLAYLPQTEKPPAPVLPDFKHFPSCDRLFARAGKPGAELVLFFEGGPQTFEHTHSDKGQFVFEAYGEALAIDPGMIGYQDPFHHELCRTTMHNAVTIRGMNQDYKDPEQAVLLDRVHSDDRLCRIDADLSNTYKALQRHKRTLLLVKPDYLLVVDDLASAEPGLEWNFHGGGDMTANAPHVRIEAEKAGMVMAVGSSLPLTFQTTVSEVEAHLHLQHKPDDVYSTTISRNLIASPPETSRSLRLAALLVPYPKAAGATPVVRIVEENEAVIRFEAEGAFGRDEIRCAFGEGAVDIAIERTKADGRETILASAKTAD